MSSVYNPWPWLHTSLNINIDRVLGVLLDERLARLDLFAHEHGEHLVGVHGVLERDLLERAGLGVHGRLPELVRVHLAEALEAVDVDLRVRVVAAHLGGNFIALLVGEGHARGLAAVELIQWRMAE